MQGYTHHAYSYPPHLSHSPLEVFLSGAYAGHGSPLYGPSQPQRYYTSHIEYDAPPLSFAPELAIDPTLLLLSSSSRSGDSPPTPVTSPPRSSRKRKATDESQAAIAAGPAKKGANAKPVASSAGVAPTPAASWQRNSRARKAEAALELDRKIQQRRARLADLHGENAMYRSREGKST